MDCVFCKIERGEIPSPRVYEDELVFAIRDLHPQAKEHYLVIPKKHYRDWNDTFEKDSRGNADALWGALAGAVKSVSESQKLAQGFRVVANTGLHGTQSVFHLHLHVVGGEQLAPKFT